MRRAKACSGRPVSLLLEHFFDLPNLLLNFAGQVFGRAFVLQVRIVGHLANFLFDLTLHFVKTTLDLVFSTRLHAFSPLLHANTHARCLHELCHPMYPKRTHECLILDGLTKRSRELVLSLWRRRSRV